MVVVLVIQGLTSVTQAVEDTNPGQHPSSSPALTSSVLKQWAEQMRTNSSAMASSRSQIEAMRQSEKAVRVWEDPKLKLGVYTASRRGPRLSEEGDLQYGAEQQLPLWGKARAEREVASHETRAAEARSTDRFESLRLELTQTLLRKAFLSTRLEIERNDIDQLDLWIQNAEQRFAVGTSSQLEILRLRNERSRRQQSLRESTNAVEDAESALIRLLRPPKEWRSPNYVLPSPKEQSLSPSFELAQIALTHAPKLKTLEQEIRVEQAKVAALKKRLYPEIMVGIDGRQNATDAGFREGFFSVALNLPWFHRDRYRSEVRAREALAESAQFESQEYGLELLEQIDVLRRRTHSKATEAAVYRDEIIPRGELAVSTAAVGWTMNRATITDLMEARRQLLEARLQRVEATWEHFQTLSELALLCGAPTWDDLPQSPNATPSSKPSTPQP